MFLLIYVKEMLSLPGKIEKKNTLLKSQQINQGQKW
jgi:hypothetical protein